MTKLIIGIHGLANKPTKATLKNWWENSLKEGLKNITTNPPSFKFEMVHWADLLYKYPVHSDSSFDFDKLYNNEPYIKAKASALKPYHDVWTDKVRSGVFEAAGATFNKLGISSITGWVIEKVLKDLDFYYDEDREILNRKDPPQSEIAFTVLKDELKNCIIANKDSEIMLIAHSMGSIISYDVLRDIGRMPNNTITIKDFITIGSPLGIPYVKQQIREQRTYDKKKDSVRTPTIVTNSWVNFADKKDPVAIDAHLRDDYNANKKGIRVVDDLVVNNYLGLKGKNNHHKSYGYLRTPELSKRVLQFLEG